MAARILIVDDEPNIVRSLQFLLRKEGYEVATAPNGGEALHQAAALTKPFATRDLVTKVHQLLDTGTASSSER